VVAEAELNVDYAGSPIVAGDANTQPAPRQRLPDTIPVEPVGAADADERLVALERPAEQTGQAGGTTRGTAVRSRQRIRG